MKQPTTLDEAFLVIEEELFKTFLKKHKDYGKGNILSVKELGIAMRVTEKIERLKHLLLSGNVAVNETLDDTWNDIAVYAIIARLLRKGQFEALNVPAEILDKV